MTTQVRGRTLRYNFVSPVIFVVTIAAQTYEFALLAHTRDRLSFASRDNGIVSGVTGPGVVLTFQRQ